MDKSVHNGEHEAFGWSSAGSVKYAMQMDLCPHQRADISLFLCLEPPF